MGTSNVDISKVRNKIVRSQLLAKQKREKSQAKLKRRIERKEAERRGEKVEKGWTRTIENTKEWLGDDDEYADEITRPAQVQVDPETGDVKVDMGRLANLFPKQKEEEQTTGPKLLITTSPGKPPCELMRNFLNELQSLLGGAKTVDIVPRRSPKYELGRVARWARGRDYRALIVVGEDHNQPSSLSISLLPEGPTAHFRLTSIQLSNKIPNHAKPTSHPPELVLNNFSTPLGLSLASVMSNLFLPPEKAGVLEEQGYIGRQAVLVQNSRDFIFVRRYRYMFALKSHRLGKQKKVGLEQDPEDDEDEVVKTRFQEIGPRFTLKLRWVKRGSIGETGDERAKREKEDKLNTPEFGLEDNDVDMENIQETVDSTEQMDEKEAQMAIGLDDADASNNASLFEKTDQDSMQIEEPVEKPKRKRVKPSHPVLRPPRSPSASPEPESVPLPTYSKNGRKVVLNEGEPSLLSAVGHTWHAGKGEGGVREHRKHREWEWQAKMQVSRRKFFL